MDISPPSFNLIIFSLIYPTPPQRRPWSTNLQLQHQFFYGSFDSRHPKESKSAKKCISIFSLSLTQNIPPPRGAPGAPTYNYNTKFRTLKPIQMLQNLAKKITFKRHIQLQYITKPQNCDISNSYLQNCRGVTFRQFKPHKMTNGNTSNIICLEKNLKFVKNKTSRSIIIQYLL